MLRERPFSQACENNKQLIFEVLRRELPESGTLLEIGSGTGQHAAWIGPRLPGIRWLTSDLAVHHEGIRAWLAYAARLDSGSGEGLRRGELPEGEVPEAGSRAETSGSTGKGSSPASGGEDGGAVGGRSAVEGVPQGFPHSPGNVAPPMTLDLSDPNWPVGIPGTESPKGEPAIPLDAIFTANTAHIVSWPQVEALMEGAALRLPVGTPLIQYGPFAYGGQHTSESNRSFDQMLRARDPLSGIRDLDDLLALAARTGFTLAADHAMPANNRTLVWRREG